MTNVSFDSDTLNAIVQKAIIEGMTPEQKEGFVLAAIKEITAPGRDYSGRPTSSPLKEAIERAVIRYMNTSVEALLDDAAKAKIDDAIKGGIAEFITTGDHDLTLQAAIGSAIGQAIYRRDR